jgi:hypothetical protein
LFQAIDDIAQRHPRVLLHGHEPLTRIFDSPATLVEMRKHLAWLGERVLEAIQRGDARAALQQRSLIPPGITKSSSQVQLAYLVLRENVINRIYHQQTGYWQADLQGMDSVSLADQGAMLMDYLGIDEARLANAVLRMIADGRHEQAAMVVQWARARGPVGPELDRAGQLAYAKLAERYQEYNPFKFIVYTGEAHLDILPVQAPVAPQPSASR